jgi:ketosteroid isomerase-like protein
MSESSAVELAKKLREAYNNFDADKPETLDMFTDDVVYRDPRFPAFEGKEALKGYLQQLAGENQAMQVDWVYTNIVAEGDQAAVEWLVKTPMEFGRKKFEFSGAAFFKVRDGRICRYTGYWDTGILQQLGGE